MSAHVHDLITSVAVAVLLAGMLPAVWQRARLPLSSCLVTATVCEALAANWATTGFWYSSAMEFADATCWALLLGTALAAAQRPRWVCMTLALVPWTATTAVMSLCALTSMGDGVSAWLHRGIVAAGALLLTLALAPTVYRRAVLPISSCVITGLAVGVLGLNFAAMAYWYAAAIEAVNSACWAWLLWVALRAPRPAPAALAPVSAARHVQA